MSSPPIPPNWEALTLISQHLDPKTLATASCVSKSWHSIMSTDHLWQSLSLSISPSLSSLPHPSFRRFYATYHRSLRLSRRPPKPPILSLHDLAFAVDVFHGDSPVLSLPAAGESLRSAADNGIFRFGFDLKPPVAVPEKGLRVGWVVLVEGWGGVFPVMGGEMKVDGERGLWLMKEIPDPHCCGKKMGLMGEVVLGFCSSSPAVVGADGKVRMVGKVGLGLMDDGVCRYMSLDDGLRYLQHFLMPSSV